ncbi:hypothetical protein TNCV_1412421 [Trichonephila clavipes]|nr:hypothetical protein TNCV_1412421 [Trichonephila clavipes]
MWYVKFTQASKTAYTNHENKLMLVNYQMQKAASELLVLHPTKNKKLLNVAFQLMERGSVEVTPSMNGCVAALSVDTGKVVDTEIMSSYCPTCRKDF